MHVLILEDEIPAHKKLVSYLSDFFMDSFTMDSTRTVAEGRVLLQQNTYDLILSDIKLLDGSSFEVFSKVETTTPIIFCTAYDAHLLEAFQTNGIAYILKPYLKEDFDKALKKFQALFETKSLEKDIFKKLNNVLDARNESYKKRFAIKKREGIKLLDASEISLIQANGDFCKIIDSQGQLHGISQSIGSLIKELNPKNFYKINRSQIVNIEHIEKIESYAKNRLALKIRGFKEYAITSSTATKEFRNWLEQ
ncbi:LytR/AlgR family response regulator transcription factor [Maribacter halichondriae]|uniref:LytR/AlgR family response regulator transcription factor n=1 Tax=Maribacter halichondriae TaxID=2980554 RepID=UPI002359E92F|nr:LytTR family DNA-binding domain-containing protein [Maribacter sp. Hal144]